MPENIIFGRKVVAEAIRAGTPITEILVQNSLYGQGLEEIQKLCLANDLKMRPVDGKLLDQLSSRGNHQGVIAKVGQVAFTYKDIDAMIAFADQQGVNPMIAILDEISDPHNLGAIIRSAECAGFHGVIIPKHRSAEVNATVMKTSAGAASYIAIAQVTNLTQAVRELKDRGFWIYGTSLEGDRMYDDMDGKDSIGIVIGSEGKGMRKMMAENCDFLVKIPMRGRIQSLNASVAAGILFFEVVRQRSKIKKP